MRFLWVMVASLWAVPLVAETILVRSGEHPDFTRLVFTLPDSTTKWALEESQKGYQFTVDVEQAEFDMTTVFARIPRTRLAELQTKGRSADMTLACKCKASAFRFGERAVVVDISVDLSEPSVVDTDVQVDNAPLPRRHVLSSEMQVELQSRYTGFERFVPAPQNEPREVEIVETEIQRAVEQGLLGREAEQPPVFEEVSPSEALEISNNINLRAMSSIDEMLKHKLAVTRTLPSGKCVPDKKLKVSEWAGAEPFADQVGTLRRNVVGEFDRIDRNTALKLARLYIHFGFGAEARQVLHLISSDRETEMLVGLSLVTEGRAELAVDTFSRRERCSSVTRFWGFLAGAEIELTAREANDVQLWFRTLPVHLQKPLGPILVSQLLEAGRTKESEQVSRFLEGASEESEAALRITHAEISEAKEDLLEAEVLLTSVLETEGPEVPEAIANLVDIHLRKKEPLAGDKLALLDALAREHRRTEHGPRLRRSLALAHALEGQYEQSFSLLEKINTQDGAEVAQSVRRDLAGILIQQAPDHELLKSALAQELVRNGGLDPEMETDLAIRLFDAGFVDLAKNSLGRHEGPRSVKRRLLLARIALWEGLPKRASAELLGLDGAEPEVLRAKAKMLSGEYSEAQKIYERIGLRSQAAEAAWLAADWKVLSAAKDTAYDEIAAIRIARGEAPAEDAAKKDEPLLANNRALLRESQELRSAVVGLLAASSPVLAE